MDDVIFDEIRLDSEYCRIIRAIFIDQIDKATTIVNICARVYNLTANNDLTHSSEYIKTRRLIRELEDAGLIKKVKGEKSKYKTHYCINSDNFTKFVLRICNEQPLYGDIEGADLYPRMLGLHEKVGRKINATVLLYFRGFFIKSNRVKRSIEFSSTINNLTLNLLTIEFINNFRGVNVDYDAGEFAEFVHYMSHIGGNLLYKTTFEFANRKIQGLLLKESVVTSEALPLGDKKWTDGTLDEYAENEDSIFSERIYDYD